MKTKIYRHLIISIAITAILLIFFIPKLTVNISLQTACNGSIQAYYYNSAHPDLILEDYDTHTAWKNISPETTSLSFDGIPALTDTLRIDIDGTSQIILSEISISYFNFPLMRYTSKNLSDYIVKQSNLTLTINDAALVFDVEGPDAFFQLESFEYISKAFWIGIYFFILVVSNCVSFLLKKTRWYSCASLREILLFIIPVLMYHCEELILGNYWFIAIPYRILNCFILIILYRLLYWFLFCSSLSVLIGNILVILAGISNHFVLLYRGRPIVPWDFFAIKTAYDILDKYTFSLNYIMIFAFGCGIFFWVLILFSPREKFKLYPQHIIYLLMILMLNIFFQTQPSLGLWDSDITYLAKKQGNILNFSNILFQYKKNAPRAPQGYSVEDLKANIPALSPHISSGVQPDNIIMIMNESFTDFSSLSSKDIPDALSFYKNLSNAIHGNLYVSVRGGSTCNTEYESLTGNSMIFFPYGAYPYQTYINSDSFSLARYLHNLGYTTTALHLESPLNWNRSYVYPLLGFDNFYSINDFEENKEIRNHVSDQDNYDKLIKLYETSNGNKNFIFNVTIQNHGGYRITEDFEPTVNLNTLGTYPEAEIFLSLMELSDSAFSNLISYFSDVDQPTMIIMYGDHQPVLGDVFDSAILGKMDSPDARLRKYITPFVIWANYDIPDMYIEKLSANYLSSLILAIGNFDMPGYNRFLLDLSEEYPVMTTQGILDAQNNYYHSIDDLNQNSKINLYEALQYNNVFEKNKINFFE